MVDLSESEEEEESSPCNVVEYKMGVAPRIAAQVMRHRPGKVHIETRLVTPGVREISIEVVDADFELDVYEVRDEEIMVRVQRRSLPVAAIPAPAAPVEAIPAVNAE